MAVCELFFAVQTILGAPSTIHLRNSCHSQDSLEAALSRAIQEMESPPDPPESQQPPAKRLRGQQLIPGTHACDLFFLCTHWLSVRRFLPFSVHVQMYRTGQPPLNIRRGNFRDILSKLALKSRQSSDHLRQVTSNKAWKASWPRRIAD